MKMSIIGMKTTPFQKVYCNIVVGLKKDYMTGMTEYSDKYCKFRSCIPNSTDDVLNYRFTPPFSEDYTSVLLPRPEFPQGSSRRQG